MPYNQESFALHEETAISASAKPDKRYSICARSIQALYGSAVVRVAFRTWLLGPNASLKRQRVRVRVRYTGCIPKVHLDKDECRVYSLRPIPLSFFVPQYSSVVLLPVMDGPRLFYGSLSLCWPLASCPVGLFPRLHSPSEGAAGFSQDLCRGALKSNERTSGDVISCSPLVRPPPIALPLSCHGCCFVEYILRGSSTKLLSFSMLLPTVSVRFEIRIYRSNMIANT